MLIYVLICLSLSLIGVAGLQFFYLIYLERIGKEYKKRIRELEKYCRSLSERLEYAEDMLRVQMTAINDPKVGEEHEEELWADIIDD
ncbi:MAG: hypothetical protein R2681_14160 [Pyrinomonadaceae bacterium]